MYKSRSYYCPIANTQITEQRCVQFHAGGVMPNGKKASDFSQETLPCLQCEGLVRPTSDFVLVTSMLNPSLKFKPYYYNQFFVFAHNTNYLINKVLAMLDMMEVSKEEKWLTIGSLHEQYNELDKALEVYQRLNSCAEAVMRMAQIHIQQKEYKKALEVLEESKISNNARFYYLMGQCYAALNQIHEAENYYLRSVKLDPQDDTCKKLANLYFQTSLFNPEKSKILGKVIKHITEIRHIQNRLVSFGKIIAKRKIIVLQS